MAIASMTGFARSEGKLDACAWVWELKSVNAKGLDVRFRWPPGFDDLDRQVRERIAARFRRGNITVGLDLSWDGTQTPLRINEDVLGTVVALTQQLKEKMPDLTPASVDGVLSVHGVLERVDDTIDEDTRNAVEGALLESFDGALSQLARSRAEEGEKMRIVLNGHMDAIAQLQAKALTLAATQPAAIRARLAEQVAELLQDVPALPEDRLAQEAALLMVKADIREELDRLAAHVSAARGLLASDEAVGRKLDFLCQEFNRESNTLCSKSVDVALTRIGLDLKSMVEQFREQVQNIE